jgi:hypothetical protein
MEPELHGVDNVELCQHVKYQLKISCILGYIKNDKSDKLSSF